MCARNFKPKQNNLLLFAELACLWIISIDQRIRGIHFFLFKGRPKKKKSEEEKGFREETIVFNFWMHLTVDEGVIGSPLNASDFHELGSSYCFEKNEQSFVDCLVGKEIVAHDCIRYFSQQQLDNPLSFFSIYLVLFISKPPHTLQGFKKLSP